MGSAVYPVPSNALYVSSSTGNDSATGTASSPLRTVKTAVSKAASGQVIVLRAGSYHEGLFVSKTVTIENYPGEAAWFDGSVPVTGWVQQGTTWVHAGWTYQFDHSASFTRGSNSGGFVNSQYPMAAWPDQLFVDGVQFDQVSSNPGAGQFAVDYPAATITMGSNPAGHEVRASDLQQAFVVSGQLTLRGVGVRRYATSLPQIGTVYFGGSTGGDVVENVVIRDNATQGISAGTHDCRLVHVTAEDNGMTGIHSNHGSGLLVADSLMQGNNTQHFNAAPAAAGIKVTNADGVTIRDSVSQNNLGVNGIWTDVTVSHFTIVGNVVAGNDGKYGIITELSDTGIVANNTVSGANYGYTAFDTGNVKVYNNAFSGNSVWDIGLTQDARRNTDPATSTADPWIVRNIIVADNISDSTAMFQFYALDKATNTAVRDMNVTIDGNEFYATSTSTVMVGWGGDDNVTVTKYRTPQALDLGLNKTWTNLQDSTTTLASPGDAAAVPLTSDVAAAIGVPTGTRHIGTFTN